MIGARGRTSAERVLDDSCVIRRLDPDAVWEPGDPMPEPTVEVYSGKCALLAPQDRRQSDGGGDERLRTTKTLLLPAGATYTEQAADQVTVASCSAPVYVVRDNERSHRVLRRIQVADSVDTEGVPR